MKRLILASLAVAALASCSKESTTDIAITSAKIPMQFSAYTGAAKTKGNPIDKNSEFAVADNQFDVSAYFTATTGSNSGKYFAFSPVKYTTAWENQANMYWPNEAGKLCFGAYAPSTDTKITAESYSYTGGAHAFGMTYAVADLVGDQTDLMYSVCELDYAAPTEAAPNPSAVNLHFKHALTQIKFTATKDADINVWVSGISICNVKNGGVFSATKNTNDTPASENTTAPDAVKDNFGSWNVATGAYKNYAAAMADYDTATLPNGIEITTAGVPLTDDDDALMLIPQALTPWTPNVASSTTDSYLAIACKIQHIGDDVQASITNGLVYIPFDTDQITYGTAKKDGWLPGYKITYNLHFGGGYTGPSTIPDPGKTPDENVGDNVVETLREISYTTSVDAWMPASDDVTLVQ